MGAAVGGIAVEARSWDGGDADFGDEVFREGHVVREAEGRNVGHDVVRAAGFEAMEARGGEDAEQPFAPLRVVGDERRVVFRWKLQRDGASFL